MPSPAHGCLRVNMRTWPSIPPTCTAVTTTSYGSCAAHASVAHTKAAPLSEQGQGTPPLRKHRGRVPRHNRRFGVSYTAITRTSARPVTAPQ
eukprot:5493099-Pyramimonas_sp.AAC.1